jgi:hypothetical protein
VYRTFDRKRASRRDSIRPEAALTIKSVSIGAVAVLVLVATILFGRSYWLPHIVHRLADLAQIQASRN